MPPMATRDAERLRQVRSFPQLVKYLRDELGWPIEQTNFEELSFDWEPRELGIDAKNAAKIDEIKQLRPLESDQPWGIFFVKFEPKRLPIVVLRRILGQLAVKKRASAKKADQRTWRADDLLFISAYGEGGDRQLSFAHFSAPDNERDIPTLRVLGWDGDDTVLKLEHVAKTLREKLAWPDAPGDLADWRTRWSSAFVLRPREVIRRSKELAVRLAELAKGIRCRAEQLMELESDRGPLRRLHEAFKTALIHDLKESDFADMYAQTITYGLFSAAVTGEGLGNRNVLVADDMTAGAPITNPFLRELLESFVTVGGRRGRIDFDELGVQEVVELLRSPDTHLPDILRDFGNQTRDEDPVIHFYEFFLHEYDRKRKVKRGVFYTPQAVVSYIVRSAHELLQTKFGLEDGLASTVTWREITKRRPGTTIPRGTSPDSPFVTILDPATGTATFLVQVIDVIHRTLMDRWKREGLPESAQMDRWNAYVPVHLLPRLFGYELMMAPYAIAHVKVGLKLLETGYRFQSDARARIYLTNALEPAHDLSGRLAFDVPALAHEAQEVNEMKRTQRFTVVVGNPPYAGNSSNRGEWIENLINDYRQVDGAPLGETKVWLKDDYVKFLRLGEQLISASGSGVLGFITNNSFLDGLTFRGMRAHLLSTFSLTYFLNLHGNTNLRERAPDGGADENVFDILQGVGISLLVRSGDSSQSGTFTADLYGSRALKYNRLAAALLLQIDHQIVPKSPHYFLVHRNFTNDEEYRAFAPINRIFSVGGLGFQSHRDGFVVAFTKEELRDRMKKFFDLRVPDSTVKDQFGIDDYRRFQIREFRRAHRYDESAIRRIQYRPFDYRYIYYARDIVQEWQIRFHGHMLQANLGLNVVRQTKSPEWRHVMVSTTPTPAVFVEIKDGSSQYPLYLYRQDQTSLFADTGNFREPNLSLEIIEPWLRRMGAVGAHAGASAAQAKTIAPEDVFGYAYAVLHSPAYRSRYSEFLKIDFPRVPLATDLSLVLSLSSLGRTLVAAHLMESPNISSAQPDYIGARRPEVGKPVWSGETIWLNRERTAGFRGVPEHVWNFQIGGYQVCDKWLKDRRGRTLSAEDIRHYQRIVVALHETIRLMGAIDEVIDNHGGWPEAFQVHHLAGAKDTYFAEPELQRVAEPKASYGAGNNSE